MQKEQALNKLGDLINFLEDSKVNSFVTSPIEYLKVVDELDHSIRLINEMPVPIIPKAAEYLIECGKANGESLNSTLIKMIHHSWSDDSPFVEGRKWAINNLSNFIFAWEFDYEVYEQKYIVELPTNRENANDEPDFYRPRTVIGRMDNGLLTIYKTRAGTNLSLHDRYRLTEQEIRDYDKRYWAFAKPIEELEQ